MPELLDNPRADRVKRVRGLFHASGRRRAGRYPVEGPQAVREAARFGDVRDLYLTPDAARRHPEIVAAAHDRGLPVQLASADVLRAMSPDCQGALAVVAFDADETAEAGRDAMTEAGHGAATAAAWTADAGAADDAFADHADTNGAHTADDAEAAGAVAPVGPLPAGRLARALSDGALTGARLIAVFAEMQDPGNAGTAIRAADAAGADAVVLTKGSVAATNPKVVRSSAGSLFHLPVYVGVTQQAAIEGLQRAGFRVLAAEPRGAVDLDALMASDPGPVAWLFGNEARGLSDASAAQADAAVRIPMPGRAESLNLAQAATLCLFATAYAQRRV